jgi:cytochrome c-type biogenesis protein CcmH/NrfF
VTEKDTYDKDFLKRVIIKFDVLFNTVVREKIINESTEKYIRYIKSYIPPKEGEFYQLKSTPLLILQLNINVTATKKKKRKSKNLKETFVEEDIIE